MRSKCRTRRESQSPGSAWESTPLVLVAKRLQTVAKGAQKPQITSQTTSIRGWARSLLAQVTRTLIKLSFPLLMPFFPY